MSVQKKSTPYMTRADIGFKNIFDTFILSPKLTFVKLNQAKLK